MIKIVIINGTPCITLAEGILEIKPKSQIIDNRQKKENDFTDFQRQKETLFMKKVLGELKKVFADKKQ
jgi:hypothetical protein